MWRDGDIVSFVITRKIEIDAGHRVPDHRSKCKNIHGHRYVIEAVCEGGLFESGEQRGMVLDFGFLKQLMVEHIDEPCDHGLILAKDDPLRAMRLEGKFYWIDGPPTAENLARHWFERLRNPVKAQSQENARLVKMRVWETPNCFAEYPAR